LLDLRGEQIDKATPISVIEKDWLPGVAVIEGAWKLGPQRSSHGLHASKSGAPEI
jgi:hypothetical protein